MDQDLIGKKRVNEEINQKKNKKEKKNKENNEDDSVIENDFNEEEEFEELKKLFKFKTTHKSGDYTKLPHKSLYRMRAHCNPLSDVSMK